jgi:hypothetical protein
LIYAETLEGEEAVRAWLVEHDIHMARLEPTSGPFREPS